jgi:sugar/nucleoside kinase (ribokinase family)
MAMTQYDAVVAGHLCLDMIPSFAGAPPARLEMTFAPGRLVQVGPVSFSTGGPVSNTGLALNKLGIRTRLIAKVGDDLFGHAIQQIVAACGADLSEGLVVDPATHTSYSLIISPPGVDRLILHHSGANDTFVADDVRYDLVAEARLFHFGYPPAMRSMFENQGAELVQVFRRAKALGVTTCLDMSLPDPSHSSGAADWRAILAQTLPHVDIFLPSIEELLFMLRRDAYERLWRTPAAPALLSELSAELLAMGAKIVGIKLGERGLYLRTGALTTLANLGRACPSHLAAWAQRELWSPCFRVDVVGTLGSGDATIAGFLSGLLRDLPIETTLTAAVAVGACNVEAADALSGIRSWEETMQRIAGGWARHVLTLDVAGWHFDERQQLWVGPNDRGGSH